MVSAIGMPDGGAAGGTVMGAALEVMAAIVDPIVLESNPSFVVVGQGEGQRSITYNVLHTRTNHRLLGRRWGKKKEAKQ